MTLTTGVRHRNMYGYSTYLRFVEKKASILNEVVEDGGATADYIVGQLTMAFKHFTQCRHRAKIFCKKNVHVLFLHVRTGERKEFHSSTQVSDDMWTQADCHRRGGQLLELPNPVCLVFEIFEGRVHRET